LKLRNQGEKRKRKKKKEKRKKKKKKKKKKKQFSFVFPFWICWISILFRVQNDAILVKFDDTINFFDVSYRANV